MFSKKVIILSVISLIVLFCGVYFLASLKTPSIPPSQQIAPTPTPVLAPGFSKSILNASPFSPFQKTLIGETQESDVKQMAQDYPQQTLPNDETLYKTTSINPLVPDVIIIKDNVVVFEETSTYTT